MEIKSYVSRALDAGGLVALVIAGAALAAFKLPLLPGDHYAPVFELFSLSFCLATLILLASRIIEISAHVSSWEDAKATRRPTVYGEESNSSSGSLKKTQPAKAA